MLIHMADDWRVDRVRAAIEGRDPTVLAEVDASLAVIGDVQFSAGLRAAVPSPSQGASRTDRRGRLVRRRLRA
jgi:hypothetical protein